MHEVTEATTCTFTHLVLTTTRLTEISDGGQLCVDRLLVVPTVVHSNHGLFRILLVLKLDIHITNQMITEVIAHVHFFNFTILLLQFKKHILEKCIVVLLCFYIVHNVRSCSLRCWSYSIRSLRFVLWVLEHILKKKSLREGWFVVKTRTFITMTASTDLEVERTIHFILLSTEDGGQILSHLVLDNCHQEQLSWS